MSDNSRIEFVETLRQQPPEVIREVCAEKFLMAVDVLTYNWIEGNPNSNWDGKPFDWYPAPRHFEHWYGEIQSNPANMFLAARKHTKTTFADCLMIWKSEYVPGHQSLYWANTQKQVRDRMDEFDEIAAANPWLKHVHGDGAAFSKSFDNGSGIDTAWVTHGYEGGHVDLQLGDDPMKELGDISDREVEHWYSNVIVPTLNPGRTLQAIIGTRKRPNDLYELLRRRHEREDFDDRIPGYNLVEYPAIREVWEREYDRPGDLAPKYLYRDVDAPVLAEALDLPGPKLSVLWPEARDPDFLVRNLGMQGRTYFLREFCMVYTQVEDAIVHFEWISDTTSPSSPPTRLDTPWQPADYPHAIERGAFDRVVVGHDPAGKGRDRFGFVTVGLLTHPHESLPESMQALAINDDGDPVPVQLRHVLDVWQAQDVPPSRWRDKLTSLYDRYRPNAIAIESNLNATWTADDDAIPSRVKQAITPIATGRGKHSWADGVPAIGSDIEAGRYRFYEGGGDQNMTSDLITALTSVRRDETGLVGHTPDLVMALYMCHKALDTGGAGSARGRLSSGGEGEKERETRRRLKDAGPIGQAIVDSSRRPF